MQTAQKTGLLDQGGPVADSSHDQPLKVVLVYEDFEMGIQGKQVFDLMAKEAGGKSAARLTVWRFDFLHLAELTHAVSRQVEEADVIIVAPRNPNQLPAQVGAWLEQWPQNRKPLTGALVAVFPQTVINSRASSSNSALLFWRAACRAQMDFICRKAVATGARRLPRPAAVRRKGCNNPARDSRRGSTINPPQTSQNS